MEDFRTLGTEARLARLETAARRALAAYGLSDAGLTPINLENNAVFQVTVGDERYALRIHRPGHKPLAWIQAELTWLTALWQNTPLGVPQPVAASDGAWVVSVTMPGVDVPLYGVLFRWMAGETRRPDTITLAETEAAGAFLARLHNFAQTYSPPPGFMRPRLDWDGLFGANSVYEPGAGAALFTPTQQTVFAAVVERVQATMLELGESRETFGLIHADFLVKNMLFQAGRVCALDFDECGWGYYLYDLTPALWQLKDEPRYAELRAAYLQGYTRIRSLPEGYPVRLETLLAARHLASIRWIAGNKDNPVIRGRAPGIIAARTDMLRHFLDTGELVE
ncbi:MAG: phosphotransferase [Anaerolineaceae bacterium]|nr:phosphotransferase [Anaerolineaceae bacterium]